MHVKNFDYINEERSVTHFGELFYYKIIDKGINLNFWNLIHTGVFPNKMFKNSHYGYWSRECSKIYFLDYNVFSGTIAFQIKHIISKNMINKVVI